MSHSIRATIALVLSSHALCSIYVPLVLYRYLNPCGTSFCCGSCHVRIRFLFLWRADLPGVGLPGYRGSRRQGDDRCLRVVLLGSVHACPAGWLLRQGTYYCAVIFTGSC